MIYIILGVGVVIVVAVTVIRGNKSGTDPAITAAVKVRDSVHITDDGTGGSYEGSGSGGTVEGGTLAEHASNGGENSAGAQPNMSASASHNTETTHIEDEPRSHLPVSEALWAGKGSRIEVAGIILAGAMTFWSSGPVKTKEPCCIDTSLPVVFDDEAGQPEIPSSYEVMTPEQRGAYLRWISRGRMGATSTSYFRTWFFGIERRALVDKRDSAFCLTEICARIPSLLEYPALATILRFATCVAMLIKYPMEKLCIDLRSVPVLPIEILNVMLSPYAGTDVRLPPIIAYTAMRCSTFGGPTMLHNDEQLVLFAAAYNERTEMGISLARPKAVTYVAYFPTNPSLSSSKPLLSLETPDFFKDSSQLSPLIEIWTQVRNMRLNKPTKPPRKKRKLPEVKVPSDTQEDSGIESDESVHVHTMDDEMRADLDAFIKEKNESREDNDEKDNKDDKDTRKKESEPLFMRLSDLSELIELDIGERPTGAQRRGLCEITRTGGRLIVPDLGIAGKLYRWDALVSLLWIEIGDRVSNIYRAAALVFEFAAGFEKGALGHAERKKHLETLLDRLKLHFELTSEENERLTVLRSMFEREMIDPHNFADSFQNCIQEEERLLLRDFFYRLCAPTGERFAKERDEYLTLLCRILNVEGRPRPIDREPPDEIGKKLTAAVSHVFRSEELKPQQNIVAAKQDET